MENPAATVLPIHDHTRQLQFCLKQSPAASSAATAVARGVQKLEEHQPCGASAPRSTQAREAPPVLLATRHRCYVDSSRVTTAAVDRQQLNCNSALTAAIRRKLHDSSSASMAAGHQPCIDSNSASTATAVSRRQQCIDSLTTMVTAASQRSAVSAATAPCRHHDHQT